MTAETSSPIRRNSLGTQLKVLANSPLGSYYAILASVVVLIALGTLMVQSASTPMAMSLRGDPYYFVTRQLTFLVVGVISAIILSRFPAQLLRRLAWTGWIVAVILLVLVQTPLGVGGYGNKNWLMLGGIQFQPSEFAKLALIIWCGAVLQNKRARLHEFWQLTVPLLPLGGTILALVLAGRDLGTGLTIGAILALTLWFIGAPMRVLAPLGAAAIGLVVLLVSGSGNRMNRIGIFLDPASNTDLSSQPMAAIYALASGGWWGLGLGAGKQKWGELKTGAHTDFIFAVLGEELGLFGVLIVIGLFALFGWAGIQIALRSETIFARITAAGIVGWILTQAVINIFVVLHLLPVLGIPLPFMSYGGSALMANLMASGVLMALAKETPEARAYLASRKKKKRPRMTSVLAAGKED